jgi:hypothetical protein
MYRKMEAPERAAGLAQLVKQLDVLEGLCVGPFVAGNTITSGDSALLGTFVFLTFILPRYFGWRDVFAGRPKLAAWWAAMQADPCARRVRRRGQRSGRQGQRLLICECMVGWRCEEGGGGGAAAAEHVAGHATRACCPCCLRVCCVAQVIDEVAGGLEAWAAKNRWEDLGIVQQLQDNRQLQWAY